MVLVLSKWIGLMAFFLCSAFISETIPAKGSTIYDFTLNDIEGNAVSLSKFKGKVVMIVNVASKCGFTNQYEGLQALFKKYEDRGFVVLGFPSNDFMGQEPGTNKDIQNFCSLNYGVNFPMFEKISVRGKKIHPLFHFLTKSKKHPKLNGKVSWNFNKFLIDNKGNLVHRFGSRTKPESKEVIKAIEALL